jgi:hypothetical protein
MNYKMTDDDEELTRSLSTQCLIVFRDFYSKEWILNPEFKLIVEDELDRRLPKHEDIVLTEGTFEL